MLARTSNALACKLAVSARSKARNDLPVIIA
jgi:hypothetical protein